MSELNRENIIKALECCKDENLPQCAKCPYLDNKVDCFGLGNEALALIKELIEENERLNLALLATTERSESRKEADISEILELRLKVDELSKENERLIDKHSENVIELPCKVGTTLYFLYNNPYADKPDLTPRIYQTTDWYFEIDKTGIVINTSDIHSFNKKYDYYLGETAFLTKQEAEQALAKMKGGAE